MANDGSLLGQSGEIKKAIESIASNIVEENTRSCFRIVKAKVTTAINNGKIGVKVPPNDLELFLPYSSACSNLAVGDLCWVALIFSSWKNAIVWQPIKFDGTGGGGGNINIINTGTGNAITSITANGLDLTVDKGASFQPLHTYLTQISSIANNLTGLIKLTNGTISLDSTSYATTTDLAKKVNDMTIGLYNGNAGNPKPIKFMSVNYSACDSNNGVFVKVSMVSGHGNGVSYTFLQDATFNVSYNGTVSVEMFKYFGASVTYNSVTRQYGDIFYVIDTVNKIVDFYCLMGQYSTMYQSPYKKLNSSSKGTITQYTTATVYSSGTQVFASGGDIVVMPDLAGYQPKNANLTSISGLATNITGLIKMTNGVASLDTTSYAAISDIPTVNNGTLTIQHNGVQVTTFTANQSTNTTANIDTHNPNLLINSNFKINQRGASSYYNGGSAKYTVDRWIKRDNADTVEVLTKGVRFKSGSGSVHFLSQTVETELYQNLLGTTVTLSIKVNAISLSGSAKLDIFMGNGNNSYANGGYEWGKLGITTTGIFSTNINIPSSITNSYLNIILSLSNASSGNYVDIEWVKLEVGNIATTFSPPTYAEEIVKCYRYYIRINNLTSAPYYPIGHVWGTGSDNRMLVYEKMRANPAITMSGAYIIYGNNGSYYSVSSMSFLERNSNAVLIKITGTNMPGGLHGTLMANNNASSYIEIDSEIY